MEFLQMWVESDRKYGNAASWPCYRSRRWSFYMDINTAEENCLNIKSMFAYRLKLQLKHELDDECKNKISQGIRNDGWFYVTTLKHLNKLEREYCPFWLVIVFYILKDWSIVGCGLDSFVYITLHLPASNFCFFV